MEATVVKCLKCNEPLTDDNIQLFADEHVTCPSQPDAKPTDLELSLLVIDLGNSCVLRVEQGSFSLECEPYGTLYKGDTSLARRTFPELRKAIEGDKPAARLEDGFDEVGNYMLFADKAWSVISPQQYDALSQLAGKPLPIHSTGTWEQLATTNGVTIWKFTR